MRLTPELLRALQGQVDLLTADVWARIDADEALRSTLQAEHKALQRQGRSGDSWVEWADAWCTQVAVAWVLTCVFVRFLEDNGLLPDPVLAGTTFRDAARVREAQDEFFEAAPTASETDYLLHVFARLAQSAAGELFGPTRNIVHRMPISGLAARRLLEFFRDIDPDTGLLRRTFGQARDELQGPRRLDTRWLGDLYQDLSEAARKRYALLQTPDFVESFLLDLTLTPALQTFGLQQVRVMDPTCGSGHLLLGAFERLLALHRARHPGVGQRQHVLAALQAVHGVDLNPFAVAIARFRLLIAALVADSDTGSPTPTPTPNFLLAPAYPLRIAVGDSLIHGRRFERFQTSASKENRQQTLDRYTWTHARYSTEDDALIGTILDQQYHVVVGNPPYITVSDKALNDTYRRHYASCHRQYALVCPFLERFFDLAVQPARTTDSAFLPLLDTQPAQPAGYVALIVANSFMKREFGAKLIEEILPHLDLTHVVDTSGAYIPGHGTPTVVLAGRNQAPVDFQVQTVMGIRGEPTKPSDPAQGVVWSAIRDHIHDTQYEDAFVTVSRTPRAAFHVHPWTLRGGGALEAKAVVESCAVPLGSVVDGSIGRAVRTGGDSWFVQDTSSDWQFRLGISDEHTRPVVNGEDNRDWTTVTSNRVWFPYDPNTLAVVDLDESDWKCDFRVFWTWRTALRARATFQGTMDDAGMSWFEYMQFTRSGFATPLSITFAFVATHNHFVLDRGGKVFNRSAPVIKLPATATVQDHLGLVGLLNSSTACFWMKMVFMNKGAQGIGEGLKSELWERFYEHDSTKLQLFPVTATRPTAVAQALDDAAQAHALLEPEAIATREVPTASVLDAARRQSALLRARMVALQEELDWTCYGLYGLLPNTAGLVVDAAQWDQLPAVPLGQRAFEIALARQMEAGQVQTEWFTRHGSTPTTTIPADWPAWYQQVVQARLHAIEQHRFVRLIEDPEFKRRWNDTPWAERERAALHRWLCNRLESARYWPQADRQGPSADHEPRLLLMRDVGARASQDEDFVAVAARYVRTTAVDVPTLVRELLTEQGLPILPPDVFKPPGLRKRRAWETTWALQRRHDALEARAALPASHPQNLTPADAHTQRAALGEVPVPPQYASGDYRRPAYWSLRGKLDVPRERFLLYPGWDPNPATGPLVGWAGWDHAQRARALADLYQRMRHEEGWPPARLLPILAALQDLVPWVQQWHDPHVPEDERLGVLLPDFLQNEARSLGYSMADVEGVRVG